MNNHITLLKREISKKLSEFSSVSFHKLEPNVRVEYTCDQTLIVSIQKESVLLKGNRCQIYRIFIESPESEKYSSVGWVLRDTIDRCMICALNGADLSHCFACGNLMCNICLMYETIVLGLETLGNVKVCMMCCWGQVIIVSIDI